MSLNDLEIIKTLPNDFTQDWGVRLVNPYGIWEHTKGKGIKIATIDSGVDASHPDLKDNIKSTVNMFEQNKIITDEFGHGTQVAGIIAGKNTGIAPESELYVAKVLDKDGYGTLAHVLDGITFAINYKVDILCISLGVDRELPQTLKDRITLARQKGIIIVCATGNSGKNTVEYPAFYDDVIAVGGIDKTLKRADFSNYGRQIDIVAPATDILSTYLNGEYSRNTGTSMASPLVAGSIALLKAYYRERGHELSLKDVRDLFCKLGNGKSIEYGYGVLDIEKILNS